MADLFDKLGVEPPKEKAPDLFDKLGVKAPTVSEGMRDAFGGGMLFNFGDEAKAAAKASVPSVFEYFRNAQEDLPEWLTGPKKAPVSQAPDWNARYTEELGKERTKAALFEAEHPALATASNIAGNVAGTSGIIAALPEAAGTALFARGASGVGNVLKGAAVGGTLGGVAGYGAGEGDTRQGNALLGAGGGAIVGGAIPPAAAVGRSIMESTPGRWVGDNGLSPVIRKVSGVFGGNAPKGLSAAAADGGVPPAFLDTLADSVSGGGITRNAAIDRIATAIQRSGRSLDSLQRQASELGPQAVIADLDPQFLSMATGVKVLPGSTRTHAENVLTGREKMEPGILRSAFEGSEPPRSNYQLRGEGQDFEKNIQAVGQRAYGAMDEAGLKQTPELMAIYENPHVKQAIDNTLAVEKSTRIGTDRPPASPVEIMHKVKQAIWDLGFDKDTARPGPNASFYRDLGIQYMDRLKAANPKLAEADAAYSQANSLPEFYDVGRNFLLGGTGDKATASSAAALADVLPKADPQQLLATRAGTTNTVRELTTGRNALSQTRALARDLPAEGIEAKVGEIYPPEQAADIQRSGNAIRTFANTSNKMLRGSQTAEKFSDSLDMGNAGFRVTPSGITPRLFEHLNAIRNWVINPNTATRDEMGRMLLNMSPEDNRLVLELASEMLKRRGQTNALRALSPGAAGNQASGP